MKYLLVGILLSLIATIVSFGIWDVQKVSAITSIIGLFFIGVSLITSGAMVSGDRMRANFTTESDEGRVKRQNISLNSFLIGLPNILVAILFYYLLNNS